MITYSDFKTIGSIQATVFTPSLSFNVNKILKKLLEIDSEIFDGSPTVLPLPQDAPGELPRIILQSKNDSYKFEIAPKRMNFFRIQINDDDIISPHEFIDKATTFILQLLNEIATQSGRIAAVIKRFCNKENPPVAIAGHFCKDQFLKEPFDNPGEFQLHAHKRYPCFDFSDVNSWVRIKSGIRHRPTGPAQQIVIAEQDINTVTDKLEDNSFTNEEITIFFSNVMSEFDKILKLYFPKE